MIFSNNLYNHDKTKIKHVIAKTFLKINFTKWLFGFYFNVE